MLTTEHNIAFPFGNIWQFFLRPEGLALRFRNVNSDRNPDLEPICHVDTEISDELTGELIGVVRYTYNGTDVSKNIYKDIHEPNKFSVDFIYENEESLSNRENVVEAVKVLLVLLRKYYANEPYPSVEEYETKIFDDINKELDDYIDLEGRPTLRCMDELFSLYMDRKNEKDYFPLVPSTGLQNYCRTYLLYTAALNFSITVRPTLTEFGELCYIIGDMYVYNRASGYRYEELPNPESIRVILAKIKKANIEYNKYDASHHYVMEYWKGIQPYVISSLRSLVEATKNDTIKITGIIEGGE